MNYLGQTFAYLKKNFWLPLAVMAVPAVVACLLSTPYWEVSFVAAFDYAPYRSVPATFRILFGDSWQYLWPVIVVAILQVFASALIMSSMDRHFRTGRLSVRNPWRLINISVFPLALSVAVMSLFSVLWRFLLFGLTMLVQAAGQGMGMPAGVALTIISAIAVAMYVIHLLVLMPVLYWPPIMFIYGYRFRDAAASSFKLVSGKKLFWGLLIPSVPCVGVQLIIGFLQPHAAVSCAVGCAVFLFTNVYITVYSMITFYDISGLERRDVKPYMNIPVPAKKPEAAEPQPPQERADEQKPPRRAKPKKPAPSSAQPQNPDGSENKQKTRSAPKPSAKSNGKTRGKPSDKASDKASAEKTRGKPSAKSGDKPSAKANGDKNRGKNGGAHSEKPHDGGVDPDERTDVAQSEIQTAGASGNGV